MGIKITEINIIGLFLFVLFGMEVFLSISFITAYLPAICFFCRSSLDGTQAEKAISGRTDEGARVNVPDEVFSALKDSDGW